MIGQAIFEQVSCDAAKKCDLLGSFSLLLERFSQPVRFQALLRDTSQQVIRVRDAEIPQDPRAVPESLGSFLFFTARVAEEVWSEDSRQKGCSLF